MKLPSKLFLAVLLLAVSSVVGSESGVLFPKSHGTGFVVSEYHILTAAHVINGCEKVTLQHGSRWADAKIVAVHRLTDLALLESNSRFGETAKFRSGKAATPGETVVRYGYSQDEGNGGWKAGAVSSSVGWDALFGRRDSNFFEYDAESKTGNSGGPILDQSGSVIGLASSSLIVKNESFAVKSHIAEHFLALNGVDYVSSSPTMAFSPRDIAKQAKKFTVLVGCWQKFI